MFRHIRHEFPDLVRETGNEYRTYTVSPERVYPSVTSVTALFKRHIIEAWRNRVGRAQAAKISAAAVRRGTQIHGFCEAYLKNETPVVDSRNRPMWESLVPVLDNINQIHCLEVPMFSDKLKIAGTPDCICEFRGRLSVIDFKTSMRVKFESDIEDYLMQTWANAEMFEERTGMAVENMVVVIAVDDHHPLVFRRKKWRYAVGFIRLRNRFREQYGF